MVLVLVVRVVCRRPRRCGGRFGSCHGISEALVKDSRMPICDAVEAQRGRHQDRGFTHVVVLWAYQASSSSIKLGIRGGWMRRR